MATERLIPGSGFLNETGTRQALVPGGAYVNETVSGGGSIITTSASGLQAQSGQSSSAKTGISNVVARSAQAAVSAVAKIAAVAVLATSGFAAANTAGPVASTVITTTVTGKAGFSGVNVAGKVSAVSVAGFASASATGTASKTGAASAAGSAAASGQSTAGVAPVGVITTSAAGRLSFTGADTASKTGTAGSSGLGSATATSTGNKQVLSAVVGHGGVAGASTALPLPSGYTLTYIQMVMVTEIWQRLGLDGTHALSESEGSAAVGTITITKTGPTTAIVSTRTGGSAAVVSDVGTMIAEIWQRLGLDPANPMTVTDTSLTFSTVTQSIVDNAGVFEVTRV